MPFEPAPKESPSARLAALIELGRAMNPDLGHARFGYLLSSPPSACAMGFACLGAGAARTWESVKAKLRELERSEGFGFILAANIESMNDSGASLDEICLSLREGELAKVTA